MHALLPLKGETAASVSVFFFFYERRFRFEGKNCSIGRFLNSFYLTPVSDHESQREHVQVAVVVY